MSVYLHAFLTAERVIFDQIRQKYGICGISSGGYVKEFPGLMPPFDVYAAVGDLRTGTEVTGEFRVLDTEMATIVSVKCDPRYVVQGSSFMEFSGYFYRVPVTKPGMHSVQFLINGELVASTGMSIERPEPNVSFTES